MAKVIIVKDLLGKDIRSRSNANAIRKELEQNKYDTLDMSDIVFVSRSFADELLAIAENKSVNIINSNGDVKTMLDLVKRSRSSNNVNSCSLGDITKLDDMKSVNDFFAAIQ